MQLQLDLLKRSKSKSDQNEALEKLGNGIKRSIHVVRQLLSLAHQEPEAKEQAFAAVNLKKLIGQCVAPFKEVAEQKNITLHIPEFEKIRDISGNASSLRIMIENLLDNAIRYTPRGGKVEVSLIEQENAVTLEVADNGVGIPAAERERVFDRFYRITGTDKSGTGLGLSIVKSIAEHHHATIRLDDGLEEKGISISVTFPVSA